MGDLATGEGTIAIVVSRTADCILYLYPEGGAGGTCPHRIRGPLGPEGPCDANWRLRVHAGIFDSEGPHRARKNTLCAPNSHTSLHKSHTPAFYCPLSAFEGPLPASQGPLATSEGYLPASEGPYRPIRDQQL